MWNGHLARHRLMPVPQVSLLKSQLSSTSQSFIDICRGSTPVVAPKLTDDYAI